MRIVSVIVVCFAPCSDILVMGDVLEQCLVIGCVLGVVRLEVRLIAGLLICLGLAENQSAINVAPFVN
jgi:hypothetical protein